ncbi:MAG: hypothetical protein AB8F74_04790 [Saprospiraceae bacterium]
MKNQILLTLCALFIGTFSLNAQIAEQSKTMSDGMQNALILELPDTDDKFVDKLWKKYLKDFKGGKSKKNKKADEVFTDDIKIPEIAGSDPIDLYSRTTEIGDDVELTLWIDLGGAYLSSSAHPEEYLEAEKLLMRFGLEVTKEKIKIEIDKEEDTLKKHKKTLKKLKRSNDNYHRDIEQAKEKIKKAEKNIEENEVDQENTQKLIEEQKETVRRVMKKLEDL